MIKKESKKGQKVAEWKKRDPN